MAAVGGAAAVGPAARGRGVPPGAAARDASARPGGGPQARGRHGPRHPSVPDLLRPGRRAPRHVTRRVPAKGGGK